VSRYVEFSAGVHLGTQVSTATFVVLHAGSGSPQARLDDAPLVPTPPVACSLSAAHSAGDSLRGGSHFIDRATGLILRCTRGGSGRLTVDGRAMEEFQMTALAHNGW
jgi:hypothetical protein